MISNATLPAIILTRVMLDTIAKDAKTPANTTEGK